MCKAIDEMREDSRNEGIEIGRKEMAAALLKEKIFTGKKLLNLPNSPLRKFNSCSSNWLRYSTSYTTRYNISHRAAYTAALFSCLLS